MRAVWGYCIACLLGALLVFVWLDREAKRSEVSALRAEKTILQARFAEASTDVVRDTVRVTKWATRWDTLTDTLTLTDSVPVPVEVVREIVRVADSTVSACRELVTSCSVLRTVADSLNHVNDSLIRKLQPSRWAKYKGPAAFVGGLVLGAWVRGQR